MVEPIKITPENLNPAGAADRDQILVIMIGGAAFRLTVGQLADLVKAELIGSAPATLDTIEEIAAAIQDNPDFYEALTDAIALKANASDTNISGLTAKTTPVDADVFRIGDSADSFAHKKVTLANLKAGLGIPIITPWAAYTPVFTSFGTVTGISMFFRRVADTLEIMGTFVNGTSVAAEARMSLPTGLTSDAVKVPSIRHCGSVLRGAAAAVSYHALIESGAGYITFSRHDGSNNPLTKMTGNQINSGETVSIKASIPISGW